MEHGLSVGEKFGGFFAHDFVGKNVGIAAMEFPGAEEGSPVDQLDDFIEGKWRHR